MPSAISIVKIESTNGADKGSPSGIQSSIMDVSTYTAQLPLQLGESIISVLPRLSSRVLFYPSLIYTMLMERWSSRDWFNRVDPNLIIGAIPFKSMGQQLVTDEGVRGVVSVNEDFERWYTTLSDEEWSELGVELLHFCVGDYVHTPSVSELQQSVELIHKIAEQDGSTYVHCKAGRTRSATVCAAYLIKKYGMTIEEAVEKLTSVRPHIVLREVHLSVLRQYRDTVYPEESNSTAESTL